jgi:hypothetical protein
VVQRQDSANLRDLRVRVSSLVVVAASTLSTFSRKGPEIKAARICRTQTALRYWREDLATRQTRRQAVRAVCSLAIVSTVPHRGPFFPPPASEPSSSRGCAPPGREVYPGFLAVNSQAAPLPSPAKARITKDYIEQAVANWAAVEAGNVVGRGDMRARIEQVGLTHPLIFLGT